MGTWLRVAATAAVALALIPTGASRAQARVPAPDPGDGPATALGPLKLDEAYSGAIDTVGDRDALRFDAPPGLSLVQVRVTHTNALCEVWATLVDIDGTMLGRSYAMGRTQNTVTGLAGAAGPLYVLIDDGPFARCAGATYTIVPTVRPFGAAAFEPPAPADGSATHAQVGYDLSAC